MTDNLFIHKETRLINVYLSAALKLADAKHTLKDHSVNLLQITGLQSNHDVIKFLKSPAGKVILGMCKELVLKQHAQMEENSRLQTKLHFRELRQLVMLLLSLQKEKEYKARIYLYEIANQNQIKRPKEYYHTEIDTYNFMIQSLNEKIVNKNKELKHIENRLEENRRHIELLDQRIEHFSAVFADPQNNFHNIYNNLENTDSTCLDELNARLDNINCEIAKLVASSNSGNNQQDHLQLEGLKHAKAHIKEQYDLFHGLYALKNGYQLECRENLPPILRLSRLGNQSFELDQLLHAFDENGEACSNHQQACYLPQVSKHLFIGQDKQFHYAKKLDFYRQSPQFIQALANNQIYFFDKNHQVTMDINQALYFNFIPRDHQIREEQGTYYVYDGNDRLVSNLNDYAQNHSAARFGRNQDKLRPHYHVVDSELKHYKQTALKLNNQLNQRKDLLAQQRDLLISCKEKVVECRNQEQNKLKQCNNSVAKLSISSTLVPTLFNTSPTIPSSPESKKTEDTLDGSVTSNTLKV